MLQVPPDRIVIQGQSLGTAVSIAVAEYFSSVRSIEFKAIVLIAAFSNVPTLVCTYSIGGIVPILSPLKYFPSVQNFFASQVQETWYNGRRLFDLVKTNRNLKLYLIHAFDDMEIPWANSDILFHIAANATNDRGLSTKQIDAVKFRRRYGERSWTDSWKTKDNGGLKFVKLQVVPYGGSSMFLARIAPLLINVQATTESQPIRSSRERFWTPLKAGQTCKAPAHLVNMGLLDHFAPTHRFPWPF